VESYLLIFVLLALVHFGVFIWLVITGFKRGVLWGLFIFFFSPLAALIFAITNWFDAKKPFLAYVLTGVLTLVPLYMMQNAFSEEHVQRIEQLVQSGEITQEQALQFLMDPELLEEYEQANAKEEDVFDPYDESAPESEQAIVDTTTDGQAQQESNAQAEIPSQTAEAEQTEEASSPYPRTGEVKPDPLQIKKKPPTKDSVRVSLAKIANFKGRYFIVTTKTGTRHRGILVDITKSQIILERKIYGGTFTYKILKSNIKTIDMLKKEYIEDLAS
jgi:hypothetical protein